MNMNNQQDNGSHTTHDQIDYFRRHVLRELVIRVEAAEREDLIRFLVERHDFRRRLLLSMERESHRDYYPNIRALRFLEMLEVEASRDGHHSHPLLRMRCESARAFVLLILNQLQRSNSRLPDGWGGRDGYNGRDEKKYDN